MARRHKQDEFIEEIRARQHNIVFPDTVRNGRSADYFFWRGSPNATLVQRIAAWLFGLTFIGLGLEFFLFGGRSEKGPRLRVGFLSYAHSARDDRHWRATLPQRPQASQFSRAGANSVTVVAGLKN